MRSSLAGLLSIRWLLVPAASSAQDDLNLDGQWEGTLTLVARPGVPDDWRRGTQLAVRIRLRGQSVRVALSFSDDAGPPTMTRFRVARTETSAVIYLAHNAEDWVETIVLTAIQTDTDTSLVSGWRVVNNTQRAPGRRYSRFAMAFLGELERVRSD
jgi:hypothetical protein